MEHDIRILILCVVSPLRHDGSKYLDAVGHSTSSEVRDVGVGPVGSSLLTSFRSNPS